MAEMGGCLWHLSLPLGMKPQNAAFQEIPLLPQPSRRELCYLQIKNPEGLREQTVIEGGLASLS